MALEKDEREVAEGGGGGGGGTGGSQSPASRTFLSLCFPTLALYCVSPVIM